MKALRTLWTDLPVLLCGSVLVGLAWSVARALPDPVSILLVMGLLVVPMSTALVAGCIVLLHDEYFGIASLFRSLPRAYVRSVSIAALPMILVGLTGFAVLAWQRSGSLMLLPSVMVGCLVTVSVTLVSVVALPYRVRSEASWAETWAVALYVSSRNPMPVLAVIAAVVLAVLATGYLSFALIILLPAPLTLIWASAVDGAITRSQKTLARNRTLLEGTR
jgi:hypothetical protein